MKPTFQGEMQLMNWGESSQSGAWVKFWIESESLESFRDLKTKSGKIAGHRMMAVLVEIGDDEQAVQREPEPPAAQEKPKGGDLARMAGVFCKDPLFHEFIAEFHEGPPPNCTFEEFCKKVIYKVCGIESRSDLDHQEEAATSFHNIIRKPFLAWKSNNNQSKE